MLKTLDFYKLRFSDLSLAKRKALVAEYGIGARSKYGDTFFSEAADERKAIGLAFAKWLVAQGQDVNAKTERGTALHAAACAGNLPMVEWLLASGAKVDARDSDRQTPLEAMLAGASNVDLEGVVPVLRVLLAAGARASPAAKRSAERAYKEMDYYRAEMAPAFRRSCEAAAKAICKLVSVTPPAPRNVHDGKSRIAVPKGSLAKRFEALWNHLVPGQGPAATVQGEVVRIAGRINDELLRNGGVNWDKDYRAMASAFVRHVASGKPLPKRQLAAVEAYVAAVSTKRPHADDARVLCKAAVDWVAANPKPAKRGAVRYRR